MGIPHHISEPIGWPSRCCGIDRRTRWIFAIKCICEINITGTIHIRGCCVIHFGFICTTWRSVVSHRGVITSGTLFTSAVVAWKASKRICTIFLLICQGNGDGNLRTGFAPALAHQVSECWCDAIIIILNCPSCCYSLSNCIGFSIKYRHSWLPVQWIKLTIVSHLGLTYNIRIISICQGLTNKLFVMENCPCV